MPVELLKTCWKQGVKLTVVDDNLSFKAAEDVMTPGVLVSLKENKIQLIELIKQQANYYDARPLSANERALWFLYRLKPESLAYNMAYAIKLKSYYSREKIAQAFVQLCQAYPILALNYGERDGEPLQWLTDFNPAEVKVSEQHQLSSKEIDAWVQQQADTKLSPDDNKTCHLALLHHHVKSNHEHPTSSNVTECYLTMVIHHIAADFISFEILRRDFMRLLNDQPVTPREYPEHDYQIWSQRQYNKQQIAPEKYWINSLQDLPPLELPTDFNYQDNLPSAGAEIQETISFELAEQIRRFCRAHNITPYIWWLGAFQWFMARLSGQDKFIIGTPSAGRLTPEDTELVGYLVNPIALYCHVNPEQSFNEWLIEIKKQSQQMLRNQAYPFANLIDKLAIDRTSSRSPVFQHMFTLNSASQDALASELVEQELLAEQRGAAHELNLVVIDERDIFTCKWRYNNGLYKQQTVNNIQQMFHYWVSQLINDPCQSLNQLATSPEYLSAKLAGPKLKPLALTAWQAFAIQVKNSSDHIAISHKTVAYPYDEFYQLIERASYQLVAQGFAQGDRLGIAIPRSIEQVIAMFASWRLGGSFLVIDTQWPQSRVDFIIQDAQIKLMLSEQDLVGQKHEKLTGQTYWLTPEQLLADYKPQDSADKLPNVEHSGQDEAYLIYTSGSTGQPKAVIVSQANLVNYVTGLDHAITLSAKATMASLSKHNTDLGYTALFGALLTGRQFTVFEESLALDSQALLIELKKYPIDCLKIVPSHLNGLLLAERDQALLPKQVLIFGGESLSSQVVENIKQYNSKLDLYNHYGPTETTIGALVQRIVQPIDSSVENKIPLGVPLANLEVKVVDNSDHIQAQGLPGELHISGENVAQGYLNQSQLSKEKFYHQQGKIWYRTGDKAILDQDKVYYIGRNDDQIKVRGHRVELGEIEAWLTQHIDQVAVVNQPNNESHAQIIAYVVASQKKLTQVQALSQQALPEYMLPASWVQLDKLPRLANGKIDKKALKKPALDNNANLENISTEKSTRQVEIEQQLLKIWQVLLNKPELSVNDDFFSAGGDSILGLQVIAKARAENISIKPQQLFQYKTISALVAALQPSQSKEELALLDIVQTLLNNTNISAQDDFFAVGGDSILSLQLVAKARQIGIQLLPKDIFEHKNIARLVKKLGLDTNALDTNKTEQTSAIVPVAIKQQAFGITPIQAWFFEQDLDAPSYWNQSVLLNVKTELNASALKQATEQLLEKHASLRLAFTQTDGIWQQHYQDYQPQWLSQIVQLCDESANENTMDFYQSQFDLSHAPLIRFVYFSQSQTLLCTAHHLVVDAVSWQIIVEDLLPIYHARCQGKSINLAPVGAEFYQWQTYLDDLVKQTSIDKKNSIEKQSDYWLQQLMPKEQNELAFNNCYDESVHQITTIDQATTANLFKQANQAYHTKTQELLITALVQTLISHWQLTDITVELEGHGRESNLFSEQESLDLSRTIGWFTSRFPQKFTFVDSLEKSIVAHKEQLRNIPENGISYGLLRYLHPTSKQYSDWGQSNLVSFNYLGRRNTEIDSNFSLNQGLAKGTRAGSNQRAHLLDINVMIYNDQLHIDWCYAKSHPKFSQINQLIQTFSVKLMEIITHCMLPDTGRATAADFPLANLDDKAFIALLSELSPFSELEPSELKLSEHSPNQLSNQH